MNKILGTLIALTMLISMAFAAVDVTATVGNGAPVISEGSILFCDGNCETTQSVDPATNLTVSVEITDPNGTADINLDTLKLSINSMEAGSDFGFWDTIVLSAVSHGTRDGCTETGNTYCLQVDTTDWTTKFIAGSASAIIDVNDNSGVSATQVVNDSGLTINATVGISNDSTSGAYSGNPADGNIAIALDGNSAKNFITTTHNGNVAIDITITGTALVDGSNSIAVGNQKWGAPDAPELATPLTGGADSMFTNWSRGTSPTSGSLPFGFYLDIPAGQPAGAYLGTLTYNSSAA